MTARLVKRGGDLAIAAVALLVLSPVIALVAAAVRLVLGRPIIFRQVRPGYRGQPFTLLKFRTMRDAYDAAGRPLPGAERLTRFGGFLRRTSLDELPQLWNVLTGDLSLVGPRPLLMEYLERYSPEQMRRHDVRPGLTGLAQISGRVGLDWDERFALDVWYVDHWSLALDLKILALTVPKVLLGAARGEGIGDRAALDRLFTGSRGPGA